MAAITKQSQTGLPKNVFESLPCTLPDGDLGDDPAILEAALKSIRETINFQSLSPTDFTSDAIWRDTFAFTGSLRTFYSPTSILKAWYATAAYRKPTDFHITSNSPASRVIRLPQGHAWVDISFTFLLTEEPRAECSGVISLVLATGHQWKIWVLTTVLEHLQGVPNVDCPTPTGQTNTDRIDIYSNGPHHFDCIVVGGGQGGLAMGGRLKALELSYLVIDKHPHVGDSWNSRYDSAKVHTTREYGKPPVSKTSDHIATADAVLQAHLPFDRTFPLPYSKYLTKGELARGYQDWVQKYGINIWQSTELKSGSYNQDQRKWTLVVQNISGDKQAVLSASHVVMAVGGGGQIPVLPEFPGREEYGGITLHSSQYRSANDWTGLNGVVVGTANTAHDVAEDMLEANLQTVTMIQRNRTYIFPAEYWANFSDTVYNDSIPTMDADRATLTIPQAVTRLIFKVIFDTMASTEPERFEALEKVGFKTEAYGDLAYHLLERMGGHYMDMGNCKNITDGKIKIKSDSSISRYTANGLEFEDGTRILADVIVYSTGFVGNVRNIVRDVFGKDIADQVDDYWGLDQEGELKGAYKPTGHPSFWYVGGPMGHCRYFSRYVAFHIKADMIGTPLKVYNDT